MRGRDGAEQRPGRLVDADVGRLGRQRDSNQQRIGIGIFEFGLGRWIGLGETAVKFESLVALHSAPITSRIE